MKILLIVTGLLVSGGIYAQSLAQRAQYLEAGIFIHSFGLPFVGDHFLGMDHSPGFSIGTSLPMQTREHWQTDYRVRLSGYFADGLHNGLHLDNQIVQSYKFSNRFRVEGAAGLGYMRLFEDGALFELVDGTYRPKRDWGRSQITLSVGFGFSFRVSKNSPYWLFAEQQLMLQVPFASKSGLPMLMQNRSHIGLRREINLRFRDQ